MTPAIERLLTDLVAAAKQCFQDALRSIILFGSGAEGRLRATSDLNLLFALRRFDKPQVDAFREPLRVANVAARASVMFVLESELPAAAEAFAVKFDDIGRRRRVLYGDDVIAALTTSRAAKKQKLVQILLNLTLRLRERYAAVSLREEQLAVVIAEAAGPLRSAAATLLELEGRAIASPKEALEAVAAAGGTGWSEAVAAISTARQSQSLPAGAAAPVLFELMALAEALRLRTERLA
jgi:predicted nucleotidyltransferase